MISSKRNLLTFDGQIMPDGRAEYRREDYVVMQFTGLVDKNGKEIYEGDIFQFFNGNNQPVFSCPSVVEWVESDARFSAWSPRENAVIIGNIYENPELLKENRNETEDTHSVHCCFTAFPRWL